jgi:dolichol-phosphate mannosyltransferase
VRKSVKLSAVIPAHNEARSIAATATALFAELNRQGIDHEILVVNDHSTDETESVLRGLAAVIPTLSYLNNTSGTGLGIAARKGLECFSGDAVALYMADGSDDPNDLVRFYRVMERDQTDCVFGTRFSKESKVIGYPFLKLVLNRCGNTFIRLLFGFRYNDVTNAFKLYRRQVIQGLQPILSHHYNITVELPLKAIVRGYSYTVVPNNWTERRHGLSKLKIKEMGSRYLFIILYCCIEKWFSKGDYHRKSQQLDSSQ